MWLLDSSTSVTLHFPGGLGAPHILSLWGGDGKHTVDDPRGGYFTPSRPFGKWLTSIHTRKQSWCVNSFVPSSVTDSFSTWLRRMTCSQIMQVRSRVAFPTRTMFGAWPSVPRSSRSQTLR